MDTTCTTLRAWALHFAARGWHVFPITPGAKKPPVVDRWETRATTDPEQIHCWWQHIPRSIGIATGPSGLVVLDLDTPKPGETTPHRWATLGISSGAGVLRVLARQHAEHHPPNVCCYDPLGWLAPLLHHPTWGAVAQHPSCSRMEDRHPGPRRVRRRTWLPSAAGRLRTPR